MVVGITNGLYLFSSSGRRERPEFPCPVGPSGDWVLAYGQFCTMSTLNI